MRHTGNPLPGRVSMQKIRQVGEENIQNGSRYEHGSYMIILKEQKGLSDFCRYSTYTVSLKISLYKFLYLAVYNDVSPLKVFYFNSSIL